MGNISRIYRESKKPLNIKVNYYRKKHEIHVM